MTSYANLIKHAYDRKGGLFQSPFRRSLISDEIHLQQAIIYTHANAQKHGIIKDFRDYPYTSYHEIVAGYSGNVNVGNMYWKYLLEEISLLNYIKSRLIIFTIMPSPALLLKEILNKNKSGPP